MHERVALGETGDEPRPRNRGPVLKDEEAPNWGLFIVSATRRSLAQ